MSAIIEYDETPKFQCNEQSTGGSSPSIGQIPLRYLGSKARFADDLARIVCENDKPACVVDLFAGVGHFAARFADQLPVSAYDASPAAKTVLQWRLASSEPAEQLPGIIRSHFLSHQAALRNLYGDELQLASSFQQKPSVAAWQRTESCFGEVAGTPRRRHDWSLVTAYFGNAYFGLDQAIGFDAIRMALECEFDLGTLNESSYLAGIVGLMCAATHLTNAPGHFAQFFDVTDENATSIAQIWSRSVWDQWTIELSRMCRSGSAAWRRRNKIFLGDSLEADSVDFGNAAIYADPPYTNAQYSRFYHLLDTFVLYDYPACYYGGRYRSERFKSRFCGIRSVKAAFRDLFELGTSKDSVLYLSYPLNGLLYKAGCSPASLASGLGLNAVLIDQFKVKHAAPGRHKSPDVVEEVWRIHG